ncbi:MAG TPA: c-type cytochrome [Candidatus Rubrimentiphilum sp.]|nr:c-type cytochrome [Candidatus Rubrimentiphilum sp.]
MVPMRSLILVCAAAFAIAGCAQPAAPNKAEALTAAAALKNGKSIFLTGKDSAGFRILAQQAPLRASCAACHRANGSGGVHLPGGAISADLRQKALVTDQNPPYTLTTLERAISTGVDNLDKPLDPVMPRWKMTPRDLHDVAMYVLTLK